MPPEPETPETAIEDPLITSLKQQLPQAVVAVRQTVDATEIEIAPPFILPACKYLKESAGFERISAITGVDFWPRSPRFEVVYFLHGIRVNKRLRLVVRVGEGEEVDSVTPVWRGANWYEREVFDLFGVPFRNHPFLERIMMPVDWEGFPLRKDYPIHGHKYSYSDE